MPAGFCASSLTDVFSFPSCGAPTVGHHGIVSRLSMSLALAKNVSNDPPHQNRINQTIIPLIVEFITISIYFNIFQYISIYFNIFQYISIYFNIFQYISMGKITIYLFVRGSSNPQSALILASHNFACRPSKLHKRGSAHGAQHSPCSLESNATVQEHLGTGRFLFGSRNS